MKNVYAKEHKMINFAVKAFVLGILVENHTLKDIEND